MIGIYSSKRENFSKLNTTALNANDVLLPEITDEEIKRKCQIVLTSVLEANIASNTFSICQQKDVFLIFNGDIYNKEQLYKINKIDKTKTNAEITLSLYKKYGLKFITQLDGIFSIILITADKIILASDPFGCKSLYFHLNSDNHLIFASSLLPILQTTPKHALSEKGLSSYFQFRFVAHPYTMFEDIFKTSPCEFLIFQHGKIKRRTYQQNLKAQSVPLKNMLLQNIKEAGHCNENIGFWLSGGLDSSILTALGTKTLPKSQVFTIKYPEYPQINETLYTDAMQKRYKFKHHIVEIKDKNVPCLFKKTIEALDEPIYSTVALSTYAIAQFSKKYVSQVISGDGSDELFLGYHYLRAAMAEKNDEIFTYKKMIGWLSKEIEEQLFDTNRNDSKLNLLSKNIPPLKAMCNFERNYRLPNYHLMRLNAILDTHSIRADFPFIRPNILVYTNNIGLNHLFSEQPKKVLITECEDLLPRIIVQRKKQPFSAPYIHWIDGILSEEINRIFSKKTFLSFLKINRNNLMTLFHKKDKSYFDYCAIWGLFILLKWIERHKRHINFKAKTI